MKKSTWVDYQMWLLSFGQQGYGLVEEGLSLEQKLKLLYAR
jgi:hypothetical protein